MALPIVPVPPITTTFTAAIIGPVGEPTATDQHAVGLAFVIETKSRTYAADQLSRTAAYAR
jgi:hypothetical protein